MCAGRGSGRSIRAFSLTELMTVVASAAVVAAILGPAVGRLSDRGRTVTCLTRIGQMTNAFIAYSQDYDGVFPFLSTMHDTQTQGPNVIETWLMKAEDIPAVARTPQTEWAGTVSVPGSGTLFTYTRSALLYRCPEFERVDDPNKTQSTFNYTRAAWGRRWKLSIECILEGVPMPSMWGDLTGPILKVGDIHQPSELPMLLDEQWDRHVATAGRLGENGSGYNCNEYGFWFENVIGVYHGAPTKSRFHNYDIDPTGTYVPFLWKQGGVGYYDGHAGLQRDPWPTYELAGGGLVPRLRYEPKAFRGLGKGASVLHELNAFAAFATHLVYAQRGFDPKRKYQGPVIPW